MLNRVQVVVTEHDVTLEVESNVPALSYRCMERPTVDAPPAFIQMDVVYCSNGKTGIFFTPSNRAVADADQVCHLRVRDPYPAEAG
jgi:hypothetical protein